MNKCFQTGFFTELMETMVSHCEMNGSHQIRIGNVSPIDGFCVWACVYNGNFIVFIHITVTNHSFHQFYQYFNGEMNVLAATMPRTIGNNKNNKNLQKASFHIFIICIGNNKNNKNNKAIAEMPTDQPEFAL